MHKRVATKILVHEEGGPPRGLGHVDNGQAVPVAADLLKLPPAASSFTAFAKRAAPRAEGSSYGAPIQLEHTT